MAASAFQVYNEAKMYMVNGTVDLDTNVVKMALFKSTSNASTFTLSTGASITNVVNAAGYTGAKTLTVSVKVGASAKQYKMHFADVIFTASGADVTSIMYAAIYVSGGKAICWSKLSTAAFTVTSGNTLTISANATGGAFTIT
jgi:hypothetical protein